jgi:hypothetical protein
MSHRGLVVVITTFVLAAAGIGVGLAVAAGGGSSSPGMMGSEGAGSSMNSYFQAMMKNYQGSSMMGSSTGSVSYGWMMGGTDAPGWMSGGSLPASMMGTSNDAGKVMGRLFADAPGTRVSATEATQIGNAVPTGATVDHARDRITFSGATDHLVVLASPAGSPDETFRIARMVNPTITVKSGARVSIELVNADSDAAHGFVITADGWATSRRPMMNAVPAFDGSALWFLGNPTAAGVHTGTLTFTATKSGTSARYRATRGMAWWDRS